MAYIMVVFHILSTGYLILFESFRQKRAEA
jgi:hypothetical protein